jgi:hypothetical protein
MHGRLDEQGVGDLVTEHAPAPIGPAVAGEAQHDIADPAVPAGAQLLPKRRLVLVEAVAHGDPHLPVGLLHLPGDPDGGLQAVGDGLLTQDVQVVFEGEVDNLLVRGRRNDDRAEVGGVVGERRGDVRIAAFGCEAKRSLGVLKDLAVQVHRGHDLDAALLHARGEDLLAPCGAKSTGPYLDHPMAHVSSNDQQGEGHARGRGLASASSAESSSLRWIVLVVEVCAEEVRAYRAVAAWGSPGRARMRQCRLGRRWRVRHRLHWSLDA